MHRFLLAGALVLSAAGAATGDIVHLKNGSTIEGAASEIDGEVHVRLRFGTVILRKAEVASIEKRPTLLEEYAVRALRIDLADAEEAGKLVRWCADEGLEAQARDLREAARAADLERRFEEARAKGADALYALATWAAGAGHAETVQRFLLERAIAADPDHAGARRALGHVWYEGAWRTRDELSKLAPPRSIHPIEPPRPRGESEPVSRGGAPSVH